MTAGNNKRVRKSKRSPSFWIGTLLIIAGVSLALFPFLNNLYRQYMHTREAEAKLEEFFSNRNSPDDSEVSPIILPDTETLEELPESLEPEEGLLEIPVLDLLLNVTYGVELSQIKNHPGFYPQSGYPDTGNVSIAGHRTAPVFLKLDELKNGDEIRLYYREKIYYYYVDDVFVTHSRDWSVIDPAPMAALTLTTCDPPGSAPTDKRLIVRAYLSDIVRLD